MPSILLQNGILRQLLGADQDLPPEVARFFLDLAFTQADNERIESLSQKASDGDLTPEEHEELSLYVMLGDFLTIMQSRARAAMKPKSPAA
jgi:hypothetical protein